MEQAGFGHFHAAGVAGVVVVMALQMQRAMHDQMRQMMGDAASGGGGFAPDHAQSEDHFGRRGFVGKDVGGFVFAAMAGVQVLDQAVSGQHDIGVGGRDYQRPGNERTGAGHDAVPGWVHDGDPKSIFGLLVKGGPPSVRFHCPCRGSGPMTVFEGAVWRMRGRDASGV